MLKSKREDGTELKSFCTLEVKDAEKGEVEAIVATLGVVDRDEDIIRRDAIPDGSKVTMSAYGHDAVWGARPAGKGKLHIEGNKVVFKGRMFLTTTDGRDTFECLKAMGGDQEWSFGFHILGSEVPSADEKSKGARRILTKLSAFEVSPVLIGAGIGTGTVGVKEETPAPPPEATPELTAEQIAANEAEAQAAAQAAADQRAAAEAAEKADAERIAAQALAEKATADLETEAFKAATLAAVADFERVQRTLKRLRFV